MSRDEIVLVVIREGGTSIARSSNEAAEVEVPDGATAIAFRIRRADFVAVDGSALEPDRFHMLHARSTDEGARPDRGACLRCLAPWGRSPRPVLDGDSCPLASGAAGEAFRNDGGDLVAIDLDPEDAAALADSIRVEWPGACACALDPASPIADLPSFRPITPVEDPFPPDALAQHDDGTVGIFTVGYGAIVDPSGARVEERLPPLDAPIAAAGALPSPPGAHRFLVTHHGTDLVGANGHFYVLEESPSGIDLRTAAIDAPIDAEGIITRRIERGLVGGAEKILLLGAQTPGGIVRFDLPSIFACDDDGGALRCEELVRGTPCQSERAAVLDLEIAGDLFFAALDTEPLLVGARSPAGEMTWICGKSPIVPPLGLGIAEIQRISRAADRIVACASHGGDGVSLLSRAATGAASLEELARLPWTHHETIRIPGCRELVSDGATVSMTTPLGTYVVSAGGIERFENDATHPDARRLDSIAKLAGGWTLAITGEGRSAGSGVYRKRDGGAYELVYGPPFAKGFYRGLSRVEGALYGFNPEDGLVRIDPGAIPIVAPVPVAGWPARASVNDAVPDSATGRIVAVTSTSVLEIDLDGGVSIVDGPIDAFMASIVELTPSRFLIGTTGSRLFVYQDAALRELEIDPDDPGTEELEGWPALRWTFFRITASAGVAWVPGAEGLLLRVAGDRVERFSPALRYLPRPDRPFDATGEPTLAVAAVCPDRLLFSKGPDRAFHTIATARGDRTSSGTRSTGLDVLPIEFFATESLVRSAFVAIGIQMVGDLPSPLSFLDTRWALRPDSPGSYAYVRPWDAVVLEDGTILLSSDDGRLVVGE